MNIKSFTKVALVAIVAPLFYACDSDSESSLSENSKITSFIIFNDSIEALDNITMTINNDSNIIYNPDSLEYNTSIDSVYCSIYGSTLSSIVINDSIVYSDTVAVNFNYPVTVRSFAKNINYYRDYTVKVLVHQVNPDLFIWNGLVSELPYSTTGTEKALYFNDELYYYTQGSSSNNLVTSTNGSTWSSKTTNLPYGVDLKRIVNFDDKLAVIYNQQLYLSSNGTDWSTITTTGTTPDQLLFTLNGILFGLSGTTSSASIVALTTDYSWDNMTTIPTGFPISGAAICVAPAPSGIYRAYLVGGVDANGNYLNSVWSTENGAYWANISVGTNTFEERTDAAVIQYSNGLMLFGGRNANGVISQTITYSPDYGLTWRAPDAEMEINTLYVSRYNLSAVVNNVNRIFLIGGRTESTFINNVWSGYQYAELPGFKN